MTPRDDHHHEMAEPISLDDAAAEALLAGRAAPDPDLGPLASLLGELRASAGEAPPAPSPALAAVLAGGPVGAELGPAPARPRRQVSARRLPRLRSRLAARLAAAGLAAKLALGSGVAAASLTGAAAAGVLPGPAQNAVAGVVAAVSPFELPRHAGGAGHETGPKVTADPTEGVPGEGPGMDPEAPSRAEELPGPATGAPAGGLDESPQPAAGESGTTAPPDAPGADTPGPGTEPATPANPPAEQPDGAPSSTPGSNPTAPESDPPAPETFTGQPESPPVPDDSGVPSGGPVADAPEDTSATPPTSSPVERP